MKRGRKREGKNNSGDGGFYLVAEGDLLDQLVVDGVGLRRLVVAAAAAQRGLHRGGNTHTRSMRTTTPNKE